MCVRACVWSAKGSKRFQLWPWRKGVLFADLWASALLQIRRGLKLIAAADKRAEILWMSVFQYFFFSVFFHTLFSLPFSPSLPVCTTLLCIWQQMFFKPAEIILSVPSFPMTEILISSVTYLIYCNFIIQKLENLGETALPHRLISDNELSFCSYKRDEKSSWAKYCCSVL